MTYKKLSDIKKQEEFMDKFSFLGEQEKQKIKKYYKDKYEEKLKQSIEKGTISIKDEQPNNVNKYDDKILRKKIEELRNQISLLTKDNTSLIKKCGLKESELQEMENLEESFNTRIKAFREENLGLRKQVEELEELKLKFKNNVNFIKQFEKSEKLNLNKTKDKHKEVLESTKRVYEDEIKKLKEELEMYKNPKTDGVGWQGKSGLKVVPLGNDEFNVITHRKNKTTLQVQKANAIISKEKVNFLLTIIRDLTDNGREETKYREVAKRLINFYKLRVGIDAFNGGHNRKTYFEIYQYPVKILEYFKIVDYSCKGVIKLINTRKKKI